MAFVRSGLGVTISQELVMQAFGCPGVVSRPLEPACCRTLGLAFSKNCQLGGEPDAAGISEIHSVAKGYTADKIRANRGERYKIE